MEDIFPVIRFNSQYKYIGIAGTSREEPLKLEKPLKFDDQKLQKALLKFGVNKYKTRFKGAWEELSKR